MLKIDTASTGYDAENLIKSTKADVVIHVPMQIEDLRSGEMLDVCHIRCKNKKLAVKLFNEMPNVQRVHGVAPSGYKSSIYIIVINDKVGNVISSLNKMV